MTTPTHGANQLALLGGTPVSTSKLQAAWPEYDATERDGLLRVLESRAWGGYPEPSPVAARFAKSFAEAHDATHGICCTNGSVTLEICLRALGLEAGDEVIVPTYTWVATGACAVNLNAVPVFVDVEPNTYCMDPDQVEAAITPRTRAVVPVHLGSTVADLDRLKAICAKHDLWLIEDCAHAHGAKWNGKGVGSHGHFGSFSFQVSKLMTSGEGGGIITSDEALAAKSHWLVNCGRKERGFDHVEGRLFGTNARMTEFQAAILEGQLGRLEDATRRRAEGAAYLAKGLAEIGGLTPLPRDPRITTQTHYQWILKYDAGQFADVPRDRVLEALAAEGVSLDGDFYVPMHEHELFTAKAAQWPQLRERYGDGFKAPETQAKLSFPVTAKAAYEEAVWMHYPYLLGSREQLDGVLEAVAKVKRLAHTLKA